MADTSSCLCRPEACFNTGTHLFVDCFATQLGLTKYAYHHCMMKMINEIWDKGIEGFSVTRI